MASKNDEPEGKHSNFKFDKKIAVVGIVSAILGVPATIALAILAYPLLSFAETATGMELVGHSGPSELVLLALFVASTALIFISMKKLLADK